MKSEFKIGKNEYPVLFILFACSDFYVFKPD